MKKNIEKTWRSARISLSRHSDQICMRQQSNLHETVMRSIPNDLDPMLEPRSHTCHQTKQGLYRMTESRQGCSLCKVRNTNNKEAPTHDAFMPIGIRTTS